MIFFEFHRQLSNILLEYKKYTYFSGKCLWTKFIRIAALVMSDFTFAPPGKCRFYQEVVGFGYWLKYSCYWINLAFSPSAGAYIFLLCSVCTNCILCEDKMFVKYSVLAFSYLEFIILLPWGDISISYMVNVFKVWDSFELIRIDDLFQFLMDFQTVGLQWAEINQK